MKEYILLALLIVFALAMLPIPAIIARKAADSRLHRILIESGRCEYRANSIGDVFLVWKDSGERVEK